MPETTDLRELTIEQNKRHDSTIIMLAEEEAAFKRTAEAAQLAIMAKKEFAEMIRATEDTTARRITLTLDQFLIETHSAALLGAWKFWQQMQELNPGEFTNGDQESAKGILRGLLLKLAASGWAPRTDSEREVVTDLNTPGLLTELIKLAPRTEGRGI